MGSEVYKLRCSNEEYALTQLCDYERGESQPCTLLDTNEIVDISMDWYNPL